MVRFNGKKIRAAELLWEAQQAWAYAMTKDSDSMAGDDAERAAMWAEEEAYQLLQEVKEAENEQAKD